MHYILVNGKPTAEPDAQKWAAWFESAEAERVVEQTQVESLMISTVFIGLDLRLLNHGRPLVYETMIFGAEGIQTLAELGRRYATLGEAKVGHWDVVDEVRAGLVEE